MNEWGFVAMMIFLWVIGYVYGRSDGMQRGIAVAEQTRDAQASNEWVCRCEKPIYASDEATVKLCVRCQKPAGSPYRDKYKKALGTYLREIVGKPAEIAMMCLQDFAEYLDRGNPEPQPDQRPTPPPPGRI